MNTTSSSGKQVRDWLAALKALRERLTIAQEITQNVSSDRVALDSLSLDVMQMIQTTWA